MDLLHAQRYEPPPDWSRVQVIDSHTGGEPFRLVVGGHPTIAGLTVLERRANAMANIDWFRRLLMWEPRGHADMYGGVVGPPERPDSHMSVLFLHNDGFSTMCGHGIIALAKIVLDTGLVEVEGPSPELRIDTPAGLVVARSKRENGLVTSTTFQNVASFAPVLDHVVETDTLGPVTFDIGYGGAFYAYVEATAIGVSLDAPADLVAAGRELKAAISDLGLTHHPDSDELEFLYGVVFSEPGSTEDVDLRNVCVFADGEIDRSPTGTGVSGRIAILAQRGLLEPGQAIVVESIVGSRFNGWYRATTTVGEHMAVLPEIEGNAHLTGRAEFWIDPNDSIGRGFLLR